MEYGKVHTSRVFPRAKKRQTFATDAVAGRKGDGQGRPGEYF